MSRNTDLSTVMFPVDVRPIGLQAETGEGDQHDTDSNSNFETIEKYQAIVRLDTHSPTTAGKFKTTASLQQEIGQRIKALSELPGTPEDIVNFLRPELSLLAAV